jgi:hypothetical protein
MILTGAPATAMWAALASLRGTIRTNTTNLEPRTRQGTESGLSTGTGRFRLVAAGGPELHMQRCNSQFLHTAPAK